MFNSIKLDVVSVLFVVSSCIAHQDLIYLDAYDESDICNRNPYSVCRRIINCPTAIEDIVSGRYPRICSFVGNEPIVCCVLQRIRFVPSDVHGLSGNSFGNVPGDTPAHPCNSSGYKPTNKRKYSWSPYEHVPRDTQRPLWSPNGHTLKDASGREPNDAKEWTPFEHLPSFAGEQPTNTRTTRRNKQFSDPETTTQETSVTLPAYTPPPPIPGIENTMSVKKCQEYGQLCSIVRDYVAGGYLAGPRELPHMALIGFGPENEKSWQCGGSIISKRYILSAAHCTYPGVVTGYAKWVRLGDLDYTSLTDGVQPKDYTIIERINHPEYNPPQLYNDIALYKVDKEIVFTDFIQPICLHTSFDISDRVAKAAGWGRVEFVGPTSNRLMYTNISFVNPEKCKDNLNSQLSKRFFPDGVITDNIVCAGEDDGSHDTCQGDSGGPLFIPQKDPWPPCLFRQVGITSTGLPCRKEKSPGLYTRVSSYIHWIESIVWVNDP